MLQLRKHYCTNMGFDLIAYLKKKKKTNCLHGIKQLAILVISFTPSWEKTLPKFQAALFG